MKLAYKILLAVILPTIIISVVFIFLIRNTLYTEVEKRFIQSIENCTHDYASLLNIRLKAISKIADYQFIDKIADSYNFDEGDVFKILSKNLSKDTLIYGASIYFDTIYEGKLNSSLLYVYHDNEKLSNICLKKDTEAYNAYFSNNFDWWTVPKKSGKGIWTSPYFDRGVGNILMITYSCPIIYKDKIIGLSTVDIRLSDIAELLLINEEAIEGEYNPNLFVLNTTDSVIIYSERKERIGHFVYLQNNSQTESSNSNYDFVDTIFASKNTMGVLKEKYDNRQFFAFYSRIKNTNWLVVNILVNSKVESYISAIITKSIILLSILIIIITLIILFTSRLITNPISKISSTTAEVSEGNYKKINLNRNDEIGILANNFDLMIEKLDDREKNLKSANKKLLVLDEAKNKFLMLISHEIRTPLNGIVGSAYFLKDMIEDPELKDFLDMLKESVDRLDMFSQTALEITQMQTVGMDMKKTNINIPLAIDNIIVSKTLNANEKQLTISTSYSEKKGITGIEDYFIRTIEELIGNAIKFSNDNTDIKIKTFVEDGRLNISVSNIGEVIPKEKIEEIIKPFGLGNDHYDKNIGLGLTYVQTFLDIHDARMEIKSDINETIITLIFNLS